MSRWVQLLAVSLVVNEINTIFLEEFQSNIFNLTFLVNGGWGVWGSFGKCSKTCGGGLKEKTRRCNKPSAEYGGLECKGKDKISKPCRTKPCRTSFESSNTDTMILNQ